MTKEIKVNIKKFNDKTQDNDWLIPTTKAEAVIETLDKQFISETEKEKINKKQDQLGYTPVNKSGDKMNGPLLLNGEPTEEKEAVHKKYVDEKISSLVNSSPETLDTLKELADAIGNDPNFAVTVAELVGTKLDKDQVVVLPEPNKILKLNNNSKLPADITGTAEYANKLKNQFKLQITGDVISGIVYIDGSKETILETKIPIADVTQNGLMSKDLAQKLAEIDFDNLVSLDENGKLPDTILSDFTSIKVQQFYISNWELRNDIYEFTTTSSSGYIGNVKVYELISTDKYQETLVDVTIEKNSIKITALKAFNGKIEYNISKKLDYDIPGAPNTGNGNQVTLTFPMPTENDIDKFAKGDGSWSSIDTALLNSYSTPKVELSTNIYETDTVVKGFQKLEGNLYYYHSNKITITPDNNASVEILENSAKIKSGDSILAGSNLSIKVTCNEGYKVFGILINGEYIVKQMNLDSITVKYTMPNNPISIKLDITPLNKTKYNDMRSFSRKYIPDYTTITEIPSAFLPENIDTSEAKDWREAFSNAINITNFPSYDMSACITCCKMFSLNYEGNLKTIEPLNTVNVPWGKGWYEISNPDASDINDRNGFYHMFFRANNKLKLIKGIDLSNYQKLPEESSGTGQEIERLVSYMFNQSDNDLDVEIHFTNVPRSIGAPAEMSYGVSRIIIDSYNEDK